MKKVRDRERLIIELRLYQQTVIDLLPQPSDEELEDMPVDGAFGGVEPPTP